MRSCQMFVFTSLNTLTTLILSSLSLAFPPSQITSITTNYTEEFRYAGKNSRGSNQASLSGNLPPSRTFLPFARIIGLVRETSRLLLEVSVEQSSNICKPKWLQLTDSSFRKQVTPKLCQETQASTAAGNGPPRMEPGPTASICKSPKTIRGLFWLSLWSWEWLDDNWKSLYAPVHLAISQPLWSSQST